MEFFGLKADECPSVRFISLGEDMTKYKPESADLGSKSIQEFVQKVLDGKVKVGQKFLYLLNRNNSGGYSINTGAFSFIHDLG